MAEISQSERHPFEFWNVAFLVEVLPLRVASLGQLLTSVTLAPNASIFHHLHQRFFLEPDVLPQYPNDFAAWADTVLGDTVVAERLANLNLFRSANLTVVRREISVILAEQLQHSGDERRAPPGEEFIFCQPRLVGFRNGLQAKTPEEFVSLLQTINSNSIGYHLFAPRRAPGRIDNDFAAWFRYLGYEALGQQLDDFDPYLNSLEENRAYLVELIEAGLRTAQEPL